MISRVGSIKLMSRTGQAIFWAIVIALLIAMWFGIHAVSSESSSALPVQLDPIPLDENYTAYLNDLPDSPVVCVEVVRTDMVAATATVCINAPFPRKAEVESRQMRGQFHEEVVILIRAKPSARLVVILPKGTEDATIAPSTDA